MTPLRVCGAIAVTLLLASCSTAAGSFDAAPSPSHSTVDKLTGTFYYVGPASAPPNTTEHEVWSWTPGKQLKRVASGGPDLLTSANISPDGRMLSWVEDAQGDATLRLRDLKQDKEIDTGLSDVDPYCIEPVWTDDHALLYGSDITHPGSAERYDVESKKSTATKELDGCHPRFGSNDPDTFTYISGALDHVGVVNGDKETKLPTDAVADRQIVGAATTAPHNAAACLETVGRDDPSGDVARPLSCDTIVDSKSGDEIKTASDTDMALFPETGGFITREGDYDSTFSLRLADREHSTLDAVDEPSALRDTHPLRYVP